ncbi:DUF2851 family protein [Gramella sp. BOM4]|nr:DUF2851 family protein [Christiangramia bathymodioli]
MREDFLYHIWKFQKFEKDGLKTHEGETLKIFNPGSLNELSGPDFFNARIQIGDQLWAGNVEIHIRSSQWYEHTHEIDSNYDNVILHVVWEHDVDIYRQNETVIPTLILNDLVDPIILESYHELLEVQHQAINCETEFDQFSEFSMRHWLERLYFERLERKSKEIEKVFASSGNNWEATLFILLFRGFGLNVNAESFLKIAESIDYRIVQKLKGKIGSLEALFLGQAGLINPVDKYGRDLEKEYFYLKHKYSLSATGIPTPQFFRLRPDNFPTIRLAQLAALFSKRSSLFDALMDASNLKELSQIFELEISAYWQSHFNFGKTHQDRRKPITQSFLSLIIINCLVPVKYLYQKRAGKDGGDLSEFMNQLKVEKNSIVELFNDLRPETAANAMESQALLELKRNYCDKNRCMECELGASLLNRQPKYH